MKKSAKRLIDNLVDAVQDFDGVVARGGYTDAVAKRSVQYKAFIAAKQELRQAIFKSRVKKIWQGR